MVMKRILTALVTIILIGANVSAAPMPEREAPRETVKAECVITVIPEAEPDRGIITNLERTYTPQVTSTVNPETSTAIAESSTIIEDSPTAEAVEEPAEEVSEEDICLIAKTVWGEARGQSYYEKCQVAWCILNRVDSAKFPNDVCGVVTQSGQYHGYSSSHPAKGDCYAAALDVYTRWLAEKTGEIVERELGRTFLYFGGDGIHNYYREVY